MAEERLNFSSHVYWIAAWRDGSLLMLPVVLIPDAIFNDFWYPALKLFVWTHAHRGVFISFCCDVNISHWKWSSVLVQNKWKLEFLFLTLNLICFTTSCTFLHLFCTKCKILNTYEKLYGLIAWGTHALSCVQHEMGSFEHCSLRKNAQWSSACLKGRPSATIFKETLQMKSIDWF